MQYYSVNSTSRIRFLVSFHFGSSFPLKTVFKETTVNRKAKSSIWRYKSIHNIVLDHTLGECRCMWSTVFLWQSPVPQVKADNDSSILTFTFVVHCTLRLLRLVYCIGNNQLQDKTGVIARLSQISVLVSRC